MDNQISKRNLFKGDNMKESKIAALLSKKNKVKIYMMANKNVTDEEIKILKKQGKFTKLPYQGPKYEEQYIK